MRKLKWTLTAGMMGLFSITGLADTPGNPVYWEPVLNPPATPFPFEPANGLEYLNDRDQVCKTISTKKSRVQKPLERPFIEWKKQYEEEGLETHWKDTLNELRDFGNSACPKGYDNVGTTLSTSVRGTPIDTDDSGLEVTKSFDVTASAYNVICDLAGLNASNRFRDALRKQVNSACPTDTSPSITITNQSFTEDQFDIGCRAYVSAHVEVKCVEQNPDLLYDLWLDITLCKKCARFAVVKD